MPAATPASQPSWSGLTNQSGISSWCPFFAINAMESASSIRVPIMKRALTFAAVVLCTSTAIAQTSPTSLFRNAIQQNKPTPAPVLLTQAEIGNSNFSPEAEIPNPFDFGAELAAPPVPQVTIDSANDAPADPSSLPTGIRHNRKRTTVDALVDYATLSGVANASYGGVNWGYGTAKAPNHVANVLLRQECVDGLWASYPAMRAAECELMWRRLTATKNCGCGRDGCQSCNSGCAQCGHGTVLNRYAQSGCDSCDSCGN